MNHDMQRLPWPDGDRRLPQERRYRGAAEIKLLARRFAGEQRRRRGRA